jgi:predicted permease
MTMLVRIAGVVLPVLAVILVGWLYGKRVGPDMRVINRIAMELLAPALVFSALAGKDFSLMDARWLLAGALVIVLGTGVLAWPIARLGKESPRTFVPPLMFNNCGNMGLPVAVLAFGPDALAPAVAMFVMSNTLHFTLGAYLVNRHADYRQVLSSPMIWATVLGAAVSIAGLHVPERVMLPLKLLGDASIPLMLLSLGVRMTSVSTQGWRIGLTGAVLCPLLSLVIAALVVPLLPLSAREQGMLFVFAALPPAVLNFMLAEQYHQEPDKVAAMVLMGNIAALIFVPFGLYCGLALA